MWYVYILECEDGSFYTGIAKDVAQRFQSHLKGTGSSYTRSHKPKIIRYMEQYPTRSEALKREYAIKLLSKEEKLKLVTDPIQ